MNTAASPAWSRLKTCSKKSSVPLPTNMKPTSSRPPGANPMVPGSFPEAWKFPASKTCLAATGRCPKAIRPRQSAASSVKLQAVFLCREKLWKKMVCASRCSHPQTVLLSACVSPPGRTACLRPGTAWTQRSNNGQQCNDCDDRLRNHAIQAPDLQNSRLDAGKVKRVRQPRNRRNQQQFMALGQRKNRDDCISGNADRRYRKTMHHRIAAMVHNAAVPVSIDVARLYVGRVVDAQRQDGNDDSRNGKKCNDVTHCNQSNRMK